jgi:tRNA-splicing ligase RtcB
MFDIKGKYDTARVFTDLVEDQAVADILKLANQEYMKDAGIRIMPDVHAGAGCVIGTTFNLREEKVCPNLVGVDIACGMRLGKIKTKVVDLPKLDKVIRQFIPSGRNIHKGIYEFKNLMSEVHQMKKKLEDLVFRPKMDYCLLSLGTLGGGNHFIELNRDDDGSYYLVIHSGSRYLGKSVADHYMRQAIAAFGGPNVSREEKERVVEEFKSSGKASDIPEALRGLQKSGDVEDQSLAYVEGEEFHNYMHDIEIVSDYADLNKELMMHIIAREMNWKFDEEFTTRHNYIDVGNKILRKGAVSAQKDEKLIIPMNMRDGSLICVGKGNSNWNFSAPHGAGRLMSRTTAKETLSMEEFKSTMKDVYSTSVHASTIDEAPMAYKPMQMIIDNIGDTVDIVATIKPVYNFKAND